MKKDKRFEFLITFIFAMRVFMQMGLTTGAVMFAVYGVHFAIQNW